MCFNLLSPLLPGVSFPQDLCESVWKSGNGGPLFTPIISVGPILNMRHVPVLLLQWLISLNVKVLNPNVKRRLLLSELRSLRADIVFLQETHFD